MIDDERGRGGVSLIHNRERFWLVDPRDHEGQPATTVDANSGPYGRRWITGIRDIARV